MGFWASGTGTEYNGTEIDYETGCGGSLTENLGYSVDFLYLTYPGDTDENMVELRLKLSANLGFAGAWARLGLPKWANNEGAANTSGHHRPQVGITVPFGATPFSVSATLGQDNKRKSCDDYSWYHVSLDTSVRGDRDPTCGAEPKVTPGDQIAGVSIARSF